MPTISKIVGGALKGILFGGLIVVSAICLMALSASVIWLAAFANSTIAAGFDKGDVYGCLMLVFWFLFGAGVFGAVGAFMKSTYARSDESDYQIP
jgi:hypothetical protein